ncbi:MAG: hypothetical protein ACOYEV_09060 [Candidatus Nanopelagicales bacterium]
MNIPPTDGGWPGQGAPATPGAPQVAATGGETLAAAVAGSGGDGRVPATPQAPTPSFAADHQPGFVEANAYPQYVIPGHRPASPAPAAAPPLGMPAPSGAADRGAGGLPEPLDARMVSQQLRALAARPEFAPRSGDLLSLADSLHLAPGEFRGWDRVDLFASFASAGTIAIHQPRRLAHMLGAAAGVVMFLPLAWTWFSLRAAALAYDRMLAESPDSAVGASFLQLWVTGFGGSLAGWHRLAAVTLVSVVLILIATGLLLGNRMAADRGRQLEEEHYAASEVSLSRALTAARRYIAQSTLTDGQSTEALVLRSIRKLEQAHAATADASQELRTTVLEARGVLEGSLEQVKLVLAQLATTTNTFDQAAAQVGGAAAAVAGQTKVALAGLASALTSAGQVYQQQSAQAQQATAEEFSKAASGLQRAHAELLRSLDAFAEARDQATGGFDRAISAASQASVAFTRDATATMEESRSALAGLREGLRELNRVIGQIEESLVVNSAVTQSQVTELTMTRDALELMSKGLLPQTWDEQR